MLNNTRWDKVGLDIWSLDSLIAWLEKQPTWKTYDYSDAGGCLLCQYFRAHGFENVWVDPYWVKWGQPSVQPFYVRLSARLPAGWNDISHGPSEVNARRSVVGPFGAARRQTFGSALKRAREYAARRALT